MSEASSILTGERVGRYRIDRRLGAGGMGSVYAAFDEKLRRKVALKLLHAHDREKLLGEARALAALDHPGVVRVYELEETLLGECVVMELVDGRSIEEMLDAGEPLTPKMVVHVLRSIAESLAAIHAVGLVHGDVKPANIIVERVTGRIVLADFGLACALDNAGERVLVSGTPAYLAPEIARGQPLSPNLRSRQDVYALGVTAFELITGRVPFDGDHPAQVLWQHVVSEPPRIDELAPVGWRVHRAIRGALAKSPERRTPTATGFVDELARGLERRGQPVRVLLIDDDDDHRQVFTTALARRFEDIVIESASDGESGYHAAVFNRPDVAVLDLAMPGVNGLELTAALRETPGLEQLPVVVVSGAITDCDRALLTRLGVSACIDKPVAPSSLAATLRGVLMLPRARTGTFARTRESTEGRSRSIRRTAD